jgi:pilus assembly protein CpaC
LSLARATALVLAVTVAAPPAEAQVLQGTEARGNEASALSAASSVESRPNEVQLLVGRSTVLNVGQAITRVSLTSPDVADAMVTASQQLLVHGKAPGTITMFVWDRSGGIRRYEVVVQRDLSQLVHQVAQLFPGEPISVTGNGEHVVLSGTVSSKYVVDKAAEVAAGYVKKKEDVVNLLKQQEGIATQQVLLRVRFAEVSRTALTELGASAFANGFKDGRWFGRTTTQQHPAPDFEDEGLVFSDFLNLFVFDAKNAIGGVIKALQSKGLFQSLAEPNLIAENGKEASFLAGGEYPYPVVQGTGGGTSVSIQFKEFGIKLNFTPTIVGDSLVHLKVRPEVSSLDFANGVSLQGFRVPALTTRRTETEVELQDGQTFAIAGLMNNTVTQTMSKIPGIGDIPILGLLFRSKAAQKDQTELVVMITPQILRRNSTGVSPTIPNIVEPYMAPPKKTLPPPAPWNPGDEPQVYSPPAAPPVRGAAPAEAVPQYEPDPEPEPSAAAGVLPDPEPAPAAVQEAPSRPAKLTREQKAEIERAKKEEKERREIAARLAEEDRKAAERQAKRDREAAEKEAKLEKKRQEQARKQAQEMAREQAKLEKELARHRAEADKREEEENRRRAAQIKDAEERLKAAQAEYQAALGEKK